MSDIKLNSTIAEGMTERLEANAKELDARIDTLKKKGLTKETVREIRDIYREILTLCQKYRVGKEYLLDYSWFLGDQNDYKEALKIGELLKYYYSEPGAKISDETMTMVNHNLGILYSKTQKMKEAEDAFLQALEITKRRAANNPEAFDRALVPSYNHLGNVYYITQRMDKAEQAFLQALEIEKRMAVNNPEAFEPVLALIYNNLGNVYLNTQRMEEAEQTFLQTLEIRKRLVANNPEAFEPDLASIYYNLGILYFDTQRMKDAEDAYLQALKIRKKLATNNPEAFEPDLARSYANLGALYSKTQRMKEAEKVLLPALEIQKRLAIHNSDAFEPDLAIIYLILGFLYSKTQRMEEAEQAYLQALELYKRLAIKNPSIYKSNCEKVEAQLKRLKYSFVFELSSITSEMSSSKTDTATEIEEHQARLAEVESELKKMSANPLKLFLKGRSEKKKLEGEKKSLLFRIKMLQERR